MRQLACVLGVTRSGELALEHRTFCDELLVPLKRHCQLVLVHACNHALVCAWRLPCVLCLRARVRVQGGAGGLLAQCTLVARVAKQLAVHPRLVALPIASPLLSPTTKT